MAALPLVASSRALDVKLWAPVGVLNGNAIKRLARRAYITRSVDDEKNEDAGFEGRRR